MPPKKESGGGERLSANHRVANPCYPLCKITNNSQNVKQFHKKKSYKSLIIIVPHDGIEPPLTLTLPAPATPIAPFVGFMRHIKSRGSLLPPTTPINQKSIRI